MVEFLDLEMPDFMPPCCLVLILWTFFISEPDKVHHWIRAAIQQLTEPVETSKLVLTTHYDIMITSRLAKNV